jgi:hypothetical protein
MRWFGSSIGDTSHGAETLNMCVKCSYLRLPFYKIKLEQPKGLTSVWRSLPLALDGDSRVSVIKSSSGRNPPSSTSLAIRKNKHDA